MNTDNTTKCHDILLPEPTLRRLPWYLAYVDILRQRGIKNVSSTKIAMALAVDASQIAKDLSFLNIKGKTRIGYDVAELADTLIDFLGFRERHDAIIMGAGSLGSALIRDSGLARYGLHIVAGFDTDPKRIGTTICDVPIYHPDDMPEVQRRLKATIGILTVPALEAQDATDLMTSAGIRGIWNFTPYRVKVTDGIVMANTSIYAHLALIYNRLNVLNEI